jgi:hypothetical protein
MQKTRRESPQGTLLGRRKYEDSHPHGARSRKVRQIIVLTEIRLPGCKAANRSGMDIQRAQPENAWTFPPGSGARLVIAWRRNSRRLLKAFSSDMDAGLREGPKGRVR